MKAKIKAIISAATATAVFSVGAVTAAYTKDEKTTVYESATVSDKFVRQDNGLTPFEEAILKGESIYDGRESCFGEGVVEYDAAQTASVRVVDKDYSETSLYQQETYSGRIGGYTYVSADKMQSSVAVPFEEE